MPEGVSFLGSASGYDINVYSIEEWEIMENAGAVFLPQAGTRSLNGSEIAYSYGNIKYWGAYYVSWSNGSANVGPYDDTYSRCNGCSVRLIQNY